MNFTLSRFLCSKYCQLAVNRLFLLHSGVNHSGLYISQSKIISLSSSLIKRKKIFARTPCIVKNYSGTSSLSQLEFLELCEEALSDITDHFEELVESDPVFKSGDISYSDGVLTAFLGPDFGTYVINRQTPNQQIWLSSPTSGPKRYNYLDGQWIYSHDKTTLHNLLDTEIGAIAKSKAVRFSSLSSRQNK